MKRFKQHLSLVILSFLFVTAAYSQVPPTLISPANFNYCVGKNINFQWTEVPNAVSYKLEVSTNPEFSNLIANLSELEETNANVELPNWNSEYYWRATSVFANNNTGVSDPWNFKTKLEPLTLVSPQNGVLCQDTTITFRWNQADAEFYRLEVSDTQDFDSLIFSRNTIVDTFFTLRLAEYSKTYYWRVSHKKATCESDFSAVWHYTTKLAPPALTFPENMSFGGDIFSSEPFSVEFNWRSIGQTAVYDFQISSSQNFADTLAESYGLNDTLKFLELPEDYNATYYWRVRVNHEGCLSYWSDSFSFKTPYQITTLELPANAATCVSMQNTFFNWTAVEGASGYRIQVSDSENFENILIDSTGINNSQISLNLNLPLKQHFWRIKAVDNNNSGFWSSAFSFVTTQRPPVVVSPTDSTLGLQKTVILNWEDFGESALYDLNVFQEVSQGEYLTLVDTLGLDLNSFVVQVPNDNTTYKWQVRVISNGCVGDWTKLQTFRTLIPSPVLLKPANNETRVSVYPIFEWEAVVDALNYDIEISKDSTFTTKFLTDERIESLIWTKSGTQYEEKTRYFWRLRARNSDGVSLWSAPFVFTTDELPADAPVIISPKNRESKVLMNPTLVWHAAPRAISYIVTIGEDEFFDNIFLSQQIADTTLEVIGLERFTNYWWKVQAIGAEEEGNTSLVYTFRTKDIAPEQIVSLISPADNATFENLIISMRWSSVERALSYELQISSTPNFEQNDIVQTHRNVQDTNRIVYDLEYDKAYYWRVAAWNEDGQAGWSVARRFNTKLNTSVINNDDVVNSHFVYPNPAIDKAVINIHSLSAVNADLRVLNIIGREIFKIQNIELNAGENLIDIDLSKFPSGLYIYSIQTPYGNTTGRIIAK
ncbi:MAG: T9SS type A sorting domain-containing protein [Candidatus Kapabacteria bacterium]|nr:T9SS type A sorting domain-containing protein [Ignavibacteriota bacterium]MCW5885134.1 T9SS type A sorting domain-containing protein [Candidatus Kapabacteria bacterium]